MCPNLNAVLWTCILTGVAGNVLCAFHHRMNACSVGNSRKAFNFLICHIAFCEKIHGNIDSLFCLFDQPASVLRGKHALAKSVKGCLVYLCPFFQFCLLYVAKISGSCNSSNSSLDHSGACFLDSGYIARYENSFNGGLPILIYDWHLATALRIIFHLTAGHF